MSIPESIDKLIERFKEHLDAYKSGKYNETQLRREFVDPFFESLGWDVGNRQSYAEAYKDVVHEDALRIDATVKSPDYSFRVSGLRKFFVETKKPSVVIKNEPAPAYQLRRYAWSAKLPLSILTDFEEFAVYDTRIKPEKTDKASTARVIYMTFNEYPSRWHEIESIFARESVLKGAFDKYSATSKQKRGTSSVDDAFLSEIESWRDMLAKNIAVRNPDLSQRELNFSVQRTIDRIVFLRISEDRGLEDYGNLLSNSSGVNVYKRLVEVFSKADQRYNSGLFHFERERDRHEAHDTLTPRIIIDDKPLKEIIKRIYYPESPYEFSVFPADILGQVYEQFLGKVIRLTPGHRAVVEEKPEVKKAGGIYYTPTYIVDYIVKNTVGELLKDKTPKQVSALRILDPACGSGSFLIGAFQYLLDWHRQWYVTDGAEKWASGKKPVLYQARGGDWRLTTSEKKSILIKNIYGVDIDSQAVEVTKLSLLLKVLENENSETISSQLKFFHERALPDLGDNIKCGNSLIGTDFYNQQELLDDEERLRINVFDWQGEFADVFKAGGFDAVIGNPPYLRIQGLQEYHGNSIQHLKDKYMSASSGSIDIYVIFLEKVLSLINKNGITGFILPHKFFQAKMGKNIRTHLAERKAVHKVINFGSNQIFQNATTYTCLFFMSAKHCDDFEYYKLAPSNNIPEALQDIKTNKVSFNELFKETWNFHVGETGNLLAKLDAMPVKLEDVTRKIFVGLQTSADKIYVLDKTKQIDETSKTIKLYSHSLKEEVEIEQELMKPFLMGKDVKRYAPPLHKAYVIFPYSIKDGKAELMSQQFIKERYPLGWQYLLRNKYELQMRENGKMNGDAFYAYIYPKNLVEFAQPKIITPEIACGSQMTLDDAGIYYHTTKVYGFAFKPKMNENVLFILGILNSKLLWYFLKSTGYVLRGGYFTFKTQYLSPFPIRTIDFSNPKEKALHDRVVSLVERMLDLKKKPLSGHEGTAIEREIQATDRQIDCIVYELYGLTEDEIGIVEGKQT